MIPLGNFHYSKCDVRYWWTQFNHSNQWALSAVDVHQLWCIDNDAISLLRQMRPKTCHAHWSMNIMHRSSKDALPRLPESSLTCLPWLFSEETSLKQCHPRIMTHQEKPKRDVGDDPMSSAPAGIQVLKPQWRLIKVKHIYIPKA